MKLGNFLGGQNFFQKIGKNTRKYPILACFSAKFGGGANFFLKKMGGEETDFQKNGGGGDGLPKKGGEGCAAEGRANPHTPPLRVFLAPSHKSPKYILNIIILYFVKIKLKV